LARDEAQVRVFRCHVEIIAVALTDWEFGEVVWNEEGGLNRVAALIVVGVGVSGFGEDLKVVEASRRSIVLAQPQDIG